MSQKIGLAPVVGLSGLSLLFFASMVGSAGTAAGQTSPSGTAHPVHEQVAPHAGGAGLHAALPLVFEENAGQMPVGTAFAGRTQQYTVELRPDELRFNLAGKAAGKAGGRTVNLSFAGTAGGRPAGLEQAGFQTNLYLGNDPAKWHTGVRNYDRVALKALYPGIDAEFYARSGEIEHDFIVAPGADAGRLAMHLAGAKSVTLTQAGDVTLSAEDGALRLHRPEAYQVLPDGKRHPVEAAFELAANGAEADLRFKLGEYDHSRTLVIDPVITYATYVAGTAGSTAAAVATDSNGDVYLTGVTTSGSFGGVTPGSNCASAPCGDSIFVAKLASGSYGTALKWLTFIGEATAGDTVVTSSVANASAVYLGGYTKAASLPSGASPAVSNTTMGYVGFYSGLDASAGTLSGTQFLFIDPMNPNDASVEAMALDGSNHLYLTGAFGAQQIGALATTPSATANDFAISPAVTSAYNASAGAQPGNAYVMEFATPFTAEPTFFTYLNATLNAGKADTLATAIAVDASSTIYVAGQTKGGFSSPPAASVETNSSGGYAAFALKFKIVPVPAAPASPSAPTVGGFEWIDGNASTTVASIGVDGAIAGTGDVYLFGNTAATNLEAALGLSGCTGATSVQCSLPDATSSGFVVRLVPNAAKTTLTPSAYTYLGGSGATDLVTGGTFASGSVYVVGVTDAPETAVGGLVPFAATPTTPAVEIKVGATPGAPPNKKALPGNPDGTAFQDVATAGTKRGFLTSLPAALNSVNYVAKIGGSGGTDASSSVAVDSSSNAYVAANIGHGSAPYTPFGSFEPVSPATAGGSAYVAEVSYSGALYGLGLAASPDSPSPDPIGYVSPAVDSSITYKWDVTASSTATASNIVVSIPAVTGLTYASATAKDATNPGASSVCADGAAGSGVSCVIPLLGQKTANTNDTWQVTLNATTNSSLPLCAAGPPVVCPSVAVAATAASPASETVKTIQTSTISKPSNLVITAIAPLPVSAYAAGTSYASYTNTTVTYNFTLTNEGASAGEAKAAVFHFDNLPASFVVTGVSQGCGTSLLTVECKPVDLIAGASETYFIAGHYSDPALFPASSTAISTTPTPFTVTATGGFLQPDPAASLTAASVIVYRAIDLTASAVTPSIATAALDAPITYSFAVTNNGPAVAYNVNLSATYPGGLPSAAFKATGASSSCGFAASLDCTVAEIDPGTSVTVTLTANFPDLFPAIDALPVGTPSKTFTVSGTALAAAGEYEQYIKGVVSTQPASAVALSAPVTVQRQATLTITTSAPNQTTVFCGTTTSMPCVSMYNPSANLNASANQYSTANYTITVKNSGPNAAAGTLISIPLPSAPDTPGGTPTTHTIVVATTPTETGLVAQTGLIAGCTLSASQATCGSATTAIGIAKNTSAVISVKGTFDTSTVPVTVPSITTGAGAGSSVGSAGVIASIDTQVTPLPPVAKLPLLSVVRSSHLIVRKSHNASVASAAGSFSDSTDPNLDEKTSATTFGVNDEIEYVVALGNGGVNDAPGVQFTETLPPYFTVYKTYLVASTSATPDSTANSTPAGASVGAPTCYAGSLSTGSAIPYPYSTKATGGQITCTLPTGYLLVADKSSTGGGTVFGTSSIEFVYQGKFQDNAPNDDDLLAGKAIYPVAAATMPATAAVGTATVPLATDYLPPADHQSVALPYNVQRAAHLAVLGTPYVLAAPGAAPSGPDALLTIDPVTAQPQAGEAEPSSVGTHPTFNCIRYKFYVQNSGPNISRTPTLVIDGDQVVFNSTSFGTTVYSAPGSGSTIPADASLGSSCAVSYGKTVQSAAGAATVAAGSKTVALAPTSEIANNSMVYDVDGYFPLNTLGLARDAAAPCYGDCGTRLAVFGSLSDPGTKDSGGAPQFPSAIPSVTVVNTPVGNNFIVTPFSAAGTAPATVTFSNVTSPGTTFEAPPAVSPAMPVGTSPYPPDFNTSTATRALYQPGAKPNFYSLPTTATVPSSGSNPTTVCVGRAGTPLPDLFVKPERVLLWALNNLSPGTGASYFQKVPNITSGAYGSGDVTTAVAPSGAAYVASTGLAFPQAPQSQPALVCGKVDGLATTQTINTETTGSSTATTFGVLEPINFPPYVVASISASSQPAKGSTIAQATVTLTLGPRAAVNTTPTGTYDYNDDDPCYAIDKAAPAKTPGRISCNDNNYLNAFLYGGGNIAGEAQVVKAYAVNAIPAQTASTMQTLGDSFNLSGGAVVYVAVADQATGADAINPNLAGTKNPFALYSEGFLIKNPSGTVTECDPGANQPGIYIAQNPCPQAGLPTNLMPGREFQIPGGYSIGNVGVVGFTETAAAGSGLIPLPNPLDYPTIAGEGAPFNPGTTATLPLGGAATAAVTAGQTAGFVWPWLSTITQSTSPLQHGADTINTTYTLQCFSTDENQTALNPPEIPCQISAVNPEGATSNTYIFGKSFAPTILIVTSGNDFAAVHSPGWFKLGGSVALGVLAPFLFLRRRRLGKGAALLTMLLSVAAAQMLTGCGSGSSASPTSTATKPGPYYFRVEATPPVANACPDPQTATELMTCEAPIYSAVFEVNVKSAN